MKFKGINMRQVPQFYFRNVQEGDKYSDGTQMPTDAAYFVPVRIKDCKKAGTFYYPKTGPCAVNIAYHSRTDLVVCLPKVVKDTHWMIIEGQQTYDYILTRYYAVIGGKVYTGTKRELITPERLAYIKMKTQRPITMEEAVERWKSRDEGKDQMDYNFDGHKRFLYGRDDGTVSVWMSPDGKLIAEKGGWAHDISR